VPVRVVVAPVEHLLHHLVIDPLALEEPVSLFNIHKVVDKVLEYPIVPLARKSLCKLLGFGESLIERVAKNLRAFGIMGVLIPLVPDPVKPLEINRGAAHRARGPCSALEIPVFDTPHTEGVTAAQLLEGTLLSEAD